MVRKPLSMAIDFLEALEFTSKESGLRKRYSHQISPNFYSGSGLLDKGDLQTAELVIMEINGQRRFSLQSHISWAAGR